MGYIEKTLISDEKIVAKFKLHWFSYTSNVIFFWLIIPLWWFIKQLYIEYGLTNKKVIIKTGVIGRATDEIKLNKIETVEVRQGIMGRILGYGNVLVTGTGTSYIVFTDVAKPLQVKKAIDSQLD